MSINVGDRVYYRYFGGGVVLEVRTKSEEEGGGVKYLIEFDRVICWMEPNWLLRRVNEENTLDESRSVV